MAEIVHLLLAAGKSERMRKPKQLLPWRKHTLIEHKINILLKTGNVVVVLGAFANEIQPVINYLPVLSFVNEQWNIGMGNSLAYGINMASQHFPNAHGILISLTDQPLVDEKHYQKMIHAFCPGKKQIIASRAATWTGVPTLFDITYHNELKALKGNNGAKKLIKKYPENIIYIEGDNILSDIDTPEAYQKMIERSKQ